VLSERDVFQGNGRGSQISVITHEKNGLDRIYWIQIYVFPCCSCADFVNRHNRGRPYLACKHIFWVYMTVYRLDLQSSALIMQGMLTVGEVTEILNRRIRI